MLFRRIHERRLREQAASSLYMAAVEQARLPVFYSSLGVPDTLEGRYDMIILHMWMIMRRFSGMTDSSVTALVQATVELMFDDMDRNLREMGVTDFRVGKRVRGMAEAFYGRATAYDKGLLEGDEHLTQALMRNLFRSGDEAQANPQAVITYIKAQLAALSALPVDELMNGKVSFVAPEVSP